MKKVDNKIRKMGFNAWTKIIVSNFYTSFSLQNGYHSHIINANTLSSSKIVKYSVEDNQHSIQRKQHICIHVSAMPPIGIIQLSFCNNICWVLQLSQFRLF